MYNLNAIVLRFDTNDKRFAIIPELLFGCLKRMPRGCSFGAWEWRGVANLSLGKYVTNACGKKFAGLNLTEEERNLSIDSWKQKHTASV